MARTKITFYVETTLYTKFRATAKARGHTMTWYFTGCMREIVGGSRRGKGKGQSSKQLALPASE